MKTYRLKVNLYCWDDRDTEIAGYYCFSEGSKEFVLKSTFTIILRNR
jgi:hypothetical protein